MIPLYDGQIPHFHDSNGKLANGFRLYFFLHNTSTPVTVYKDAEGRVPYTNPIVLDARGESETPIYVDPNKVYKIVLKDKKNAVVWEENEITASAHVKSTIPFAIDEDDFEMNNVAGALVLSLKKHLAITNTSELFNDGDGNSPFLTEESAAVWEAVTDFVSWEAGMTTDWDSSTMYVNRKLGLAMLNVNVFAKVNTSRTLQTIGSISKYLPVVDVNERLGMPVHAQVTSTGTIRYFDSSSESADNGSYFRHTFIYPYKR